MGSSWIPDLYDDIEDAVNDINDTIWDVTQDLYTDIIEESWKVMVDPIIEEVLSWFGVEDETVINSSISINRLMTTYPDMRVEHALMSQKDGMSLQTRMNNYTKGGPAGSLHAYQNNGVTNFIDGLPITQLKVVEASDVDVKAVLDSLFTPVTLLVNYIGSPERDTWGDYYLQNNFNLIPSTGILQYAAENWNRNTYSYDTINDNFIVELIRTITVTVVDRTTTVIDTVDTTETTTETTDRIEITDNMTTVVEVVTVAGTPIVTVQTGDGLNDGTTIVDVQVSQNESFETNIIAERVPIYGVHNYYHVRYTIDSDVNSHEYIWMYARGTAVYPSLDTGDRFKRGLDMFPIVPLRQKFVSLVPGSPRYLSSKEQLGFLGLDIDIMLEALNDNADIANVGEAFIVLAIDLTIDSDVVSKAAYEMFDMAYADGPGYATFSVRNGQWEQEGSYNHNVTTTLSKTLLDGVIAPVGKHTKYINSAAHTIRVRKQILPDKYIEFQSGTFAGFSLIHKNGEIHFNQTLLTVGTPFLIPIAHNILGTMSSYDMVALVAESLHMVVYAAVTQDLEYYETEIFGELVKVAAIVLAIVTFGASWKAYGIWVAIGTLGLMLATPSMIEWVLEHTDNPVLRAIAIAAIIAINIYVGSPNGIESLTAVDLALMSVTGISTAIQIYSQYEMDKLLEKTQGFQTEYEKKMQDIIDANKQSDSIDRNTWRAQRISVLKVETPDSFFARTLNTFPAQGFADYDLMYDYDKKVDPRKVVV